MRCNLFFLTAPCLDEKSGVELNLWVTLTFIPQAFVFFYFIFWHEKWLIWWSKLFERLKVCFLISTRTHILSLTHIWLTLILSKQTFYHTSSFTSAYFTYTSSTSPFKHAPKPSIGLSMKPSSSLPWNHRVPQRFWGSTNALWQTFTYTTPLPLLQHTSPIPNPRQLLNMP